MKRAHITGLIFAMMALTVSSLDVYAQTSMNGPAVSTHTYATKEGEALLLDIYSPVPSADATGKRPVLIFSYGGAWEGGKKEDGKAFMEALAKEGYIGVSINYRLGIKKLKE